MQVNGSTFKPKQRQILRSMIRTRRVFIEIIALEADQLDAVIRRQDIVLWLLLHQTLVTQRRFIFHRPQANILCRSRENVPSQMDNRSRFLLRQTEAQELALDRIIGRRQSHRFTMLHRLRGIFQIILNDVYYKNVLVVGYNFFRGIL